MSVTVEREKHNGVGTRWNERVNSACEKCERKCIAVKKKQVETREQEKGNKMKKKSNPKVTKNFGIKNRVVCVKCIAYECYNFVSPKPLWSVRVSM